MAPPTAVFRRVQSGFRHRPVGQRAQILLRRSAWTEVLMSLSMYQVSVFRCGSRLRSLGGVEKGRGASCRRHAGRGAARPRHVHARGSGERASETATGWRGAARWHRSSEFFRAPRPPSRNRRSASPGLSSSCRAWSLSRSTGAREAICSAGPYMLNFTGTSHPLIFAMSYLHLDVTMAYDILRHKGVLVGNMDSLGSMPRSGISRSEAPGAASFPRHDPPRDGADNSAPPPDGNGLPGSASRNPSSARSS